jgi:predicted enzyme related to lactoylglutathione lyase
MPMTDATLATPAVAASDTIRTIGILHFTIGVRDHIAAAKFYSEVLGCRHLRSNERYSFMECGGSYTDTSAVGAGFDVAKRRLHDPDQN